MKKDKWIILLFFLGILIILYPHAAQYINKAIQKSQVQQLKQETKLLNPDLIFDQVSAVQKCNEAIFKNEDSLHDPFTEYYTQERIKGCKDVPNTGNHIAAIEIPKLNV